MGLESRGAWKANTYLSCSLPRLCTDIVLQHLHSGISQGNPPSSTTEHHGDLFKSNPNLPLKTVGDGSSRARQSHPKFLHDTSGW